MSKKELATVCGLCCSACNLAGEFCKEPCSVAKGKMNWGQCPVYTCCTEKGFEHCGLCPDFPCWVLDALESLEKGLNLPVNNEIRGRNLKRRTEIGTEKWVEEMEAKFKKS